MRPPLRRLSAALEMMRLSILISLPLLALAAGCTREGAAEKAAGPGAAAASGRAAPGRAARPVPVEVQPVEGRRVAYAIESVGSLLARETLRLPARVAGVVQDVKFQEGTYVTLERVLARIDPERYRLTAERAEANLKQAEAQGREVQAALDKRRALHSKDAGLVSEEELTSFTAKLDQAQAALAAARAAHALALKDLRDSDVKVDFPGTIDRKHIDTGQYVEVGDAMATIVDNSRLKLSFKVTESESARLTGRSRITFKVRALPGREFSGRLYHIGEVADPSTRMVECLAWVENRDRALRPGFFAEVTAEAGESVASLVVPQTAVLPTERGFVAFVVSEGDVVERRQVRLGLYTRDGGVEVLEGLAAGERLVVRGASLLSEGARVEVK